MIDTRYKKLTGTHAGHIFTVTEPYGEIETPLHWVLHCETDEEETLIVPEDELGNPKLWEPLDLGSAR